MYIQALTQYFLQYGSFFIFLIVLLEYMNPPGFTAGVIMPPAGIWAAKREIGFPLVMLPTGASGLMGSRIFLWRSGSKGIGIRLAGVCSKNIPVK